MCKQNSESDILIYRGLDIPPKGTPKQNYSCKRRKTKHKRIEELLRYNTSCQRPILVRPV